MVQYTTTALRCQTCDEVGIFFFKTKPKQGKRSSQEQPLSAKLFLEINPSIITDFTQQ